VIERPAGGPANPEGDGADDHGPTGPTFGAAWSASLRRGSEAELRRWLEVALACADAADALARASFRRDLVIETKPDRTFVTEADTAIERAIRERLTNTFPDHGLVGEEYGTEHGEAATRWYIDPIDGTHNFMRGVPLFGTLLAVERDGELQVGVLSAPALGERWYASRGGGAWAVDLKGWGDPAPRRVSVSGVRTLGDAQILYGSQGDVADSGKAPGFASLLRDAWRDRGFGDFWGYALVAEGAAEAMIEADLSAWDLAAPTILIEEAGGRVTDFAGERSIHRRSALASNGHLHDLFLRRLATEG
jgi:histidinol-phosphatase